MDPNSPRGTCYVNNSYKYLKLLGIFFSTNKRMGFGQRYRLEIPEPSCAIFIPAWGPNWGFRVFPGIKITAICQVCICCGLSANINTHEMLHGVQRSWVHFVCVCFRVCGQQKPKYPQLELHGWRCHYTGRYRSSGSLFYICGFGTKKHFWVSE